MVKADSRYESIRANSLMVGFWGLAYIGMWAIIRFYMHTSVFLFLMFAPFYLAVGLFLFLRARRFKSLNARRQAAARGNMLVVPLAASQPLLNETALPLPYTIKMRPRWGRSLVAAGLFALYIILGMIAYTLISGTGEWALQSLAAPIITLSLALPVFILTSLFLVWAGHYQITATEEDLVVWQTGSTLRIRWDEAFLFATMPRRARTAPPNLYELSGIDSIIPVHRVRRNSLFPLSMKPTIPFDDYDCQMDALLSLIAAKTGLPLYDLR